MKFCINCGTSLESKKIEEKQRSYCPGCNRIHYEQLKVGAGAIIELDKKILLLQRTQAPFANSWNLPAGYVEADESPIQAVIREVHEEVGYKLKSLIWWMFISSTMIREVMGFLLYITVQSRTAH